MKAILLNRILLVLAFVGLFVAGVLSLEAGLNLEVPCGGGSGCATVAKDPSSRIAGIPVAYIGLAGYLILAGLAVFRALTPVREWRRWVSLGYLVAVVGAGVSLWLQYKSFFVIHATCIWCLSSAAIMVVSLIVYALLAQEMENQVAEAPRTLEPDTAEAVATPAPNPAPDKTDRSLLIVLPVLLGIALFGTAASMKAAPNGPKFDETLVNKNIDILLAPGVHSVGPDNAPLTIVEFADLACPACKRTSPQVKEFVSRNPGKVKFVYRHFPLPMHVQSTTAAMISEVAADENRFWEYIMAVMALPEEPKEAEQLIEIAKTNGISEKIVRKRLADSNDAIYKRVARDLQAVKTFGINSTPTYFMITDGKVIDVLGPGQIIEQLNSEKYRKIISGNGS